MIGWSGTAKIHRIDGTSVFALLEPLHYTDSDGLTYTVQPGMMSDGASIPRFLQSWVGSPIAGEYLEAAILHDATCRSGWFPIRACDQLMHRAMEAHHVDPETINAIDAALRVSRIWRRKPPVDPAASDYLAVTHAPR